MNLKYNSKISYLIKRPKLYEFIREKGIRVSDIISIEERKPFPQSLSLLESMMTDSEIRYNVLGDKFILHIDTDKEFSKFKCQLILKKLGEDLFY